MQNNEWTDPEIATLRSHRAEGMSAGGIAKLLGRTRNSVLGKVNRLSLEKLDPHKCQFPNGRQTRKRSPPKPKLAALEPMLPDFELLVNGERVTIETVTSRMCRFPLGSFPDFYFCAHPVADGKPYCAPHAHRCYTPSLPRRDARNVMGAEKQFGGR